MKPEPLERNNWTMVLARLDFGIEPSDDGLSNQLEDQYESIVPQHLERLNLLQTRICKD
jgi:hypothetical protein